MKVCLFYHSIVSDWNHGNAHFLRGIVNSLLADGHRVIVFEPSNGCSLNNMIQDAGTKAVKDYIQMFPDHEVRYYNPELTGVDPFGTELDDADLVIVHEWNTPSLISEIGKHRKTRGKYILLFHDTHHRSLSDTKNMAKNDLTAYDGVLAFGEVIRHIYLKNKWAKAAWTWHEAADTTIFHPVTPEIYPKKDLVWIGNWGDEERTEEIYEFIIRPVKELGLQAVFYGVRYPAEAIRELKRANIEYKGWIPNYRVPSIFSQFHLTIHVPRRLYTSNLKGIPTIRPFEAMACGIPLISSPWHDTENLFRKNKDYLMVEDGAEMKKGIKSVLSNEDLRKSLINSGLETIRSRHTCDTPVGRSSWR
jgi:spore maturation protein CgeB